MLSVRMGQRKECRKCCGHAKGWTGFASLLEMAVHPERQAPLHRTLVCSMFSPWSILVQFRQQKETLRMKV